MHLIDEICFVAGVNPALLKSVTKAVREAVASGRAFLADCLWLHCGDCGEMLLDGSVTALPVSNLPEGQHQFAAI